MNRMRTNIWESAFALFAMVFLLGGCMQEMDFEEGRKGVPSKYISFTASVKPITASVETRSAGRLTVESEEWPIKGVVTRGAPALSFPENAGIVAYTTTSSVTTLFDSIDDKEFSFDNEALSAADNPIPWRNVKTTDQMDVYAYAPYSFIHPVPAAATINTAGTSPVISYTVPSDVTAQKDLIVANSMVVKASDEYDKTIDLDFTHALAAIRFRMGFECYVKSISIQNVYGSATYNYSSWTPTGSQDASYTVNVSDGSMHFDENEMVTDGENTLMLIPQTTSNDNAKVVLTYKETAEGAEKTLVASIMGNEWVAGKRITYIINKDETVNYIYFDLAAGNVTIQASGSKYVYTGYVYTNGNGTKATVTGDHNSANKYYVYQSTAANRNSTGWSGAVGSTMTLPSYPTVLSPDGDGKTWSQFVTNNPNAERIVGLWNDGSPASTHPLRQAGRTVTSNEIKFTAAASPGDLLIDMVIDNIWLQNDSYYTSAKSNKDGPFFLNGQNNAAHVGLDLRLKGDNFINRIIFDMRNTADYFRVTSFDGDNSINGSLTVTPKNANPYDDDYGMLGAVQSLDDSSKDHYGLEFNGGTIYVAGQLNYRNLSSMPAVACLGGGPNGNIRNMRITGGILTVVAHCTGAAIGGGGGFTGRGGDADITISGGQTYAYQFGAAVYYKRPEWAGSKRNLFITSTAIGGGSSFTSSANEGNVTIEGDAYVYAQSVGGVAIGGGSSGGLKGGSANITIQGNPTVIAKSINGTITNPETSYVHTVSAGTSIGGGSGGDEDNSYTYDVGSGYDPDAVANGGSAIITFQNNAIVYAGSIGGGKNGFKADAEGGDARLLGSATVNLSDNVLVQGQFIMEAPDADTAPTFTMTGGTLQPNKAGDVFHYVKPNGGAVWIDGGTFTLSGTGTIKDFSVAYDAGSGDGGLGGAVFMQSTTRASAFNMSGGTIGGCTATSASGTNGLGGAVYMDGGTFSMSGGTIGGSSSMSNQATNGGGAVYLDGGSFNMTGGTISFNRSTANSGGGVFIKGGSFTMDNSSASINYNYAFLNGGGVNVVSDAEAVAVNVVTGTISNNTAERYGGGVCVIPSGVVAANVIYGTDGSDNTALPAITYNGAGVAGGGLYAEGSEAHITLYSGKIKNNSVSANVPNQDIANQYGSVTLQNTDVTAVTITFNVNGGVLSSGSLTQKVAKGTNSLLVLPSVTRQNYNLTDWNTAADGSGTSYTSYEVSPGSGTYNTHDLTGDTTFYAIWTALP